MKLDYIIKQKNIIIYGNGLEGKSSCKFILEKFPTHNITIFDEKKENVTEDISKDTKINYVYPEHPNVNKYGSLGEYFNTFDLTILGQSIDRSKVKDCDSNKITSNTEIFFNNISEDTRKHIIGITGTKGKSTVTKFVYELLINNGFKTKIAGNFGVPFLDLYDIKCDYIVAEMSSFQLEFLKISPGISLFLDFYQDHLNRHKTMQNYLDAKSNIWKYQKEGDYTLTINRWSSLVKKTLPETSKLIIADSLTGNYFNKNSIFNADYYLENFGIVKELSKQLNIHPNIFTKTAKNFVGLPHRMETVAIKNNIEFIDDAIASNPDATIANVNYLKNKIGSIILGGQNREQKFADLINILIENSIHIIVFKSEVSSKILSTIEAYRYENYSIASSLKNAVSIAFAFTTKNKICLLSPAAPSYDNFKNFTEEGEKFKEYILNYGKKGKVVIIGVAGGALYYIAKYFRLIDTEVIGYDLASNARTEELKSMDAVIINNNPDQSFDNDVDVILYTLQLPDHIIKNLKEKNQNKRFIEAGHFYMELVSAYENQELSEIQEKAFIKADLAPLFAIDSNGFTLIGVTGTDGKTTTTLMIYNILQKAGIKTGVISTVAALINGKEIDTGLHTTTPTAQEIYRLINQMKQEGCTHIILECTSHGLSTGRLAGLKFDYAVYTNITREHIDQHQNIESYIEAKKLLATKYLKKDGIAIINRDDPTSYENLKRANKNQIFYTKEANNLDSTLPMLQANNIKYVNSYPEFDLKSSERFNAIYQFNNTDINSSINLNMFGEYNISNALAAITVGLLQKIEFSTIQTALQSLPQVSGRTEVIQKNPFYVIVDFAHTGNALNQVLKSMQKLKSSKENRIIVVFGCAGKRDKYKRELMGKAAGDYADITILTAEDPRTESLKDINDQIEKGWRSSEYVSNKQIIRFDDDSSNVVVRKDAIKKALEIAKNGDIVIICGKAHEQSLCFGHTEYPWNDIVETKNMLL